MDTDGRCPDDMSNDLILQHRPLLLYLLEEILKHLNQCLCLGQLTLSFLWVLCCLLSSGAITVQPCP